MSVQYRVRASQVKYTSQANTGTYRDFINFVGA